MFTFTAVLHVFGSRREVWISTGFGSGGSLGNWATRLFFVGSKLASSIILSENCSYKRQTRENVCATEKGQATIQKTLEFFSWFLFAELLRVHDRSVSFWPSRYLNKLFQVENFIKRNLNMYFKLVFLHVEYKQLWNTPVTPNWAAKLAWFQSLFEPKYLFLGEELASAMHL